MARAHRADLQTKTWSFDEHCPRCRANRSWLVTEYPRAIQTVARCAGCTSLKPLTNEHRSRGTSHLPSSCLRSEA